MTHWKLPLIVLSGVFLAACMAQPRDDDALNELRRDLAAFREETNLSSLVPLAMADAERAVRAAGEPAIGEEERAHRIRLAGKRIEIARAEAFHAVARADLDKLEQRRTELLLRASRLEVDQARQEAEIARLISAATMEEIERARRDATTAEERREAEERRAAQAREEAEQAHRVAAAQASEIELARREAELAARDADTLRRRLDYLELRETDRGVVVTLGDVLFEVGQSELMPNARSNLQDVVELLQTEPGKPIRIEGHTDSTGPVSLNMRLSEQRARSVRNALVDLGIDPERIQVVGMGPDFPIAGNDTAEGRARNRRVDVILLNQ